MMINNKNMIKYIIILGVIYSLLKLVPEKTIENKDLMLIMAVIVFLLLTVEHVCKTNYEQEDFENGPDATGSNVGKDVVTSGNVAGGNVAGGNVAGDKVAVTSDTDTASKVADPIITKIIDATVDATISKTNNLQITYDKEGKPYCVNPNKELKIDNDVLRCVVKQSYIDESKAKLEAQSVIGNYDKLKVKSNVMNNALDNKQNKNLSNIMNKYYMSLVKDLIENGIITKDDVVNMELKMNTNIATMEDMITGLEKLKEQGKSKIPKNQDNRMNDKNQDNSMNDKNQDNKAKSQMKNGKVNDDNIYNELDAELSKPIGLDIANKWESQYSILNTDKWKVPTSKPPVCVNTAPCQVCPSTYSGYVDLSTWDTSRKLSDTHINQQWAKNQQK